MNERFLAILASLPDAAAALPPYLLLLLLFLLCWLPFLLSLLVRRALWPTVRRRAAAKGYRRRRLPQIAILLGATATIAGILLWSRTSPDPLSIYGEGPTPNAVQRIAYDLTLERDGGLLVTEEMTLALDRDVRALFRPLRRDQPTTVLSLTVDGRAKPARVWIGPQYGIRLGAGTPAGTHVYRLTYRLRGAARDAVYAPTFFSGPGFRTCLSDLCTETPIQRVRWRPVTWTPAGEQVFTWRFPRPLTLADTGLLNGRYTWLAQQPQQLDERTLQFRADLSGSYRIPEWLGAITVPDGMTTAEVPSRGSYEPSLPVFLIPVLALLGVIVARVRIGGRPRGRPTLKAEYAPPDGLSAGQLGELAGARAGVLAIAALADAAARGVLRVDTLLCRRPWLPDQWDDEFVLTGGVGALPPPERRYVAGFLHGRSRIRASQLEDRCSTEADALSKDLHASLRDAGYYNRRRELQRVATWLLALVLLVGGPYAMFFAGNQLPWLLPVSGEDGADASRFTEAALIAWTLAATVVALFATMIPTITAKGALTGSEALGFAEYLRTAELGPVEHELREGYAAPELPYAMALGLAPSLIARWHRLTTAPENGDDNDVPSAAGAPRFGDENVERWRLLHRREGAPAAVAEGGGRAC